MSVSRASGTIAFFFATASANAAPVVLQLPPEPLFVLKPGPAANTTANVCSACHSLDYIRIQPPRLGSVVWNAEVHKMVKAFGAPIPDTEAAEIANYLQKNY